MTEMRYDLTEKNKRPIIKLAINYRFVKPMGKSLLKSVQFSEKVLKNPEK